jgi:hypothetical protein
MDLHASPYLLMVSQDDKASCSAHNRKGNNSGALHAAASVNVSLGDYSHTQRQRAAS